MVTLVPSDAFWGLTDTVPFPLPAPTETVYLLELLIFAVLAFCIGLLVRKPFIGTNHFVSEKLEETELM